MAIDVKPEALGQSVLEGGAITPGAAPEKALAAKLFKNEVKVKGPRKATEAASARKTEADSKKARKNISENIGSAAPDPITGAKVRNPEEEARFDTANNNEQLAAKFIKEGKGWSGLSPAEQTVLRGPILEEIKTWVNSDTVDYFATKTPAEVNAIVDGFLAGDVEIFDKVKELYEARLVNPVEKIDSGIAEKKAEEEKALEDIERKTKEIEQNQEEQKKQYEAVESFGSRRDSSGRTINGENKRRLDEVTRQLTKDYPPAVLQALKTEQAQYDQEVRGLRDRLKAENAAGKAKDNVEIGRLRGLLTTAEGNLRVTSNKLETQRILLEEKDGLVGQKVAAERRYEELTQEHIAKTTELDTLQKKLHSIRAEIGIAGLDRADAEKAFVESVKNILPDAVNEVFMQRMKVMEEGYDKMRQEEIDGAEDPYTKALLTGLKLRHEQFKKDHGFMHTELKRKVTGRETNKKSLQQDIDELESTDPDAARQVVTRALFQATNPDTGQKYTATEASAFISANPDFVKNNIPLVTADIISRGLQTGQVRVKEMEKFVLNGHITNEKMVETFTKSQAMKKKLEQAGVTDSKLKEMGKRVGNKKLWMWLALFALSPMVATGVGLFVVGKDMVKPGPKEHGDGKKDKGKKDEPETTPETPEAEA